MRNHIDYTLHNDLIVAENLGISYGSKVIVRDIGNAEKPFIVKDIHRANVQQGQTVAVLGRSGRGKSTFFKALTGIIKPTAGSIKIPCNGNGTGDLRTIREGDVGFVQQNYPLSRNQSIYHMLLDAAKQGQVPPNDRKKVIEEHLETWGLTEQRNQAPNQLSGGQKQRVAIIEQLLCSHYFMVFDEPFSGLDICNIEDVKNSFNKITSTHEINTIIFSTHDIELAVELADQIYVMGYQKDKEGKFIPGGTIIGHFDLKQMDLAWQGCFNEEHRLLSIEIKKLMAQS